MKPTRIYAAGIVDKNDDWVFQGTVIAESSVEARLLLAQFKKLHSMSGRCEVTTFGNRARIVNLTKGVFY